MALLEIKSSVHRAILTTPVHAWRSDTSSCGKLQNLRVQIDVKRPIILPTGHHFTHYLLLTRTVAYFAANLPVLWATGCCLHGNSQKDIQTLLALLPISNTDSFEAICTPTFMPHLTRRFVKGVSRGPWRAALRQSTAKQSLRQHSTVPLSCNQSCTPWHFYGLACWCFSTWIPSFPLAKRSSERFYSYKAFAFRMRHGNYKR